MIKIVVFCLVLATSSGAMAETFSLDPLSVQDEMKRRCPPPVGDKKSYCQQQFEVVLELLKLVPFQSEDFLDGVKRFYRDKLVDYPPRT